MSNALANQPSISSHAPRLHGAITHDAAALEFARQFSGKLLYDHTAASWFQWTGTHWQKELTGLAFELARQLTRDLADRTDGHGRDALGKANFTASVERLARTDRTFAITSDKWDGDPFLLGTPSGTVDLRTGKLRAADPNDRLTKSTAVAPAPTADCPRFLKFLNEATGSDVQLIRFLQQFCGYSLTGSIREHALGFIYGPGKNGKSVFANTVAGILNDYATVAPMDMLLATNNSRHPTELAMLRGQRLVTSAETEDGSAWAEAKIKQLTGGDQITARFMRQDFFTFSPNFKLLIVGNYKPTLRNVDEAMRRRINIIEFTRIPALPDLTLEAKLRKEEWPGILRWMLDGCLDWLKEGLVRPQSVVKASEEYLASQDIFGQWLDDACDADAGNRSKVATSGALFESWRAYAILAGDNPGNAKRFADAMHKRGFEKHRGRAGVRQFLGVSLKIPVPADLVTGDAW
jgi:putative DNA primase/helicase